jgi:hypothetical protein
MGLPVGWLTTTEGKHQKIAFNPDTLETVDLETGKVSKHKTSPLGFIKATEGTVPLPCGTKTPVTGIGIDMAIICACPKQYWRIYLTL